MRYPRKKTAGEVGASRPRTGTNEVPVAIDKADFTAVGKMFGELMALDLSIKEIREHNTIEIELADGTVHKHSYPIETIYHDAAYEFVERYLPFDEEPNPEAFIDSLRASQKVLSSIADVLLDDRLDLDYIILKTAEALSNPHNEAIEERRAGVVYSVAEQKYWCAHYGEEAKHRFNPCNGCNGMDGLTTETCPGCGRRTDFGLKNSQLRHATQLIRCLEVITPEFRKAKLEPEYVRRELTKRGRSPQLIAAVLSIRAGAFGDDLRAKELQAQAKSPSDAARTIAKSFDVSAKKRLPEDALDQWLTWEQQEKKERTQAKQTRKPPA